MAVFGGREISIAQNPGDYKLPKIEFSIESS
jgi:hypothetical protein